MAFLAEQAGGIATNGEKRILDITPTSIHNGRRLLWAANARCKNSCAASRMIIGKKWIIENGQLTMNCRLATQLSIVHSMINFNSLDYFAYESASSAYAVTRFGSVSIQRGFAFSHEPSGFCRLAITS